MTKDDIENLEHLLYDFKQSFTVIRTQTRQGFWPGDVDLSAVIQLSSLGPLNRLDAFLNDIKRPDGPCRMQELEAENARLASDLRLLQSDIDELPDIIAKHFKGELHEYCG